MDKGDVGGPASNSSSDFVRKLYKMLEDPSYETIVRWGEGGESFVVLENDKFTKHILPKHFKHSNFASFVRQLNKYDFHKVRQSNEDNIPSPYGPNAWEFKHPEFKANNKDSLDNIRRKAPAPRKTTQGMDEQIPAQQIDLVNNQLVATQQQLQHLSERYQALESGNSLLLSQVFQLQRFVKNHDGIMRRVVGFLQGLDAERRNGRNAAAAFKKGVPDEGAATYHPASPLQKASELLNELSAENLPNKDLEQMTQSFRIKTEFPTPIRDHIRSATMPPQNETSTAPLGFPLLATDLDNMVYPVGHTNGIDPINSAHINNIPYAMPSSTILPVETVTPVPEAMPQPESTAVGRKKGVESLWGSRKPKVLLVEDDPVCAQIGAKFLEACDCGVETALNGLEAVNKINATPSHYDLILMDIIMPHLDGVSATVLIKEIRNHIPIIAMTSNIRADDIDVYFKYGMNDVLAKPFTKENMIRALNKHLPQFKKTNAFPNSSQMPHPGSFVTTGQSQNPLALNMGQLSAAPSIKDEASPGKSPATASSWHSPNQIPGASPVGSVSGNFMQQNSPYNLPTPTHNHPPPSFPAPGMVVPRAPPQRRVLNDMTSPDTPDDHPEKRQRMFPGSVNR